MPAAVEIRRAGGARWPALAVLCTAQFVDVLDVNVVLVALPAIGRSLGMGAAELQWVVTAYALAFAGFLLLAGRLADLIGPRRLFVCGLVVFTLASLGCGLAREPLLLVVGRAVQGLGAAITAPAALAIITTSFREGRERNAAIGAWTAVAAGGGAAGLVTGGVITDSLGWQWVFFVNVPVGLAAVALSPLLLPEDRARRAAGRADLGGAATVTAGLALAVFAFSRAEQAGAGSAEVIAPLLLAAACLGSFVLVERRVAEPLVPLRILRSGELASCTLVAAVLTATTSATAVLATLYLQGVLGYAPGVAGLAALPMSLAVIGGSVAGPRVIRRFGPRAAMTSGLLTVAAGALVAGGIGAHAGLGFVVSSGALQGFGLGLASVAATARGASAVAAAERGLASGLLTTAAQIGTALGVSTLVWLASARTGALGAATPEAIVTGYRWAFLAAAGMAAFAALTLRRLIRPHSRGLTP
jgi:EmrB/QacA subfamily drug resistance transporter